MATTKDKGDLAELRIASDLMRQGYKVAIPFGDNWDFDLILYRDGFERVQVKYAQSDGEKVEVKAVSYSTNKGLTISAKQYTAAEIDWLAVYDVTTDECFYVPASELGDGMRMVTLRYKPARNNQTKGIRWTKDYGSVE